jgi:hypothetical protein
MPRYLALLTGDIARLSRVLMAALCLLALPKLSSEARGQVGNIYLVIGSDTAIWNAGNTVDVYSRHPYYPQDFYTRPGSPAFQVMDPAWRDQYKDSFGQPVKFTWWLMGGNIYRDASNNNFPFNNTMVPYLMKKYHGDAIRQFGDELSLHYHTFLWSDYTGSGTYYWNQSMTFQECRNDFDYTLAQYLLEEEIFPVSFRSGWHFMDNNWQTYLNDLTPYCMHNNWPAYQPWYFYEPIGNVQNWWRATPNFIPFHPATNDYQLPGNGRGWDLRSIKMQAMAQSDMDSIFQNAANGVDQIACIWDHLPEDFVDNFEMIDAMAHASESNFPGVQFHYCTAIEGMRRWRGLTNQTPPRIDVTETPDGPNVILTIQSSAPLFQPRPFVAMRDVNRQFSNVTALCVASGPQTWTITLPCPRNQLAKVGVAATDTAGNLATKIIRYLPDDIYVDNLDPQYSETSGNWQSTTNAAWGVDARTALLASNSTARAQWVLPVSNSGFYALSIQLPSIARPAGNMVFNVLAGSSNLFTTSVSKGVPPLQWFALGTVFLDASQTNCLQMTVSGAKQAGTFAMADVVRAVPVPSPPFSRITGQFTARGLALSFSGIPNAPCQIQRSTDLEHWTTLTNAQLPAGGTIEYIETAPPSQAAFYRIH